MAGWAGCRARVTQLFLTAPEHPLERHFEFDFDVLAALRAAGAPPEKRVEQPPAEIEIEAAENVIEIDAGKQILGRKVRHAGKTVGVVLSALLGIGEYSVGRSNLLEAFLGAGLLVAVGVKLQRELPEGVLDRLLIGVARDA